MRALRLLTLVLGLLVAASLLSACGSLSLASDITPPPDYTPPTDALPVSQGPSYPLMSPDPQAGAPLYVENCAPCHGETGKGDGPRAAQLSNPVPALGLFEVARASRPADWYAMVTNGNMEMFMPPFKSLSDQQRWDVLAYVYTLSTTDQTLAAGKAIYNRECAACHGVSGDGDGAQAAALAVKPVLTDQSRLSQRSLAELRDATLNGVGEAMPAYSGKLSEDESWAVVSYVRSLTFDNSAVPEPVAAAVTPTLPAGDATPDTSQPTRSAQDITATPAAQTVSISGKVSMSNGKPLPEGLTVTLTGYDGMQQMLTDQTTVQADGSYEFPSVENLAGRVFMTEVSYNDLSFNSDIAHPAESGEKIDLPITIYETSSDPAALEIDRMHVFFDFSAPGSVQVVELVLVSNLSESVVMPAADGQPVLRFDLPEGATNLQFQDSVLGERYIATASGFGDTAGIAPGVGQHQVLFAYELPYERKLELSLPIGLPVKAAIVMLPVNGTRLKSDQLTDSGTRPVEDLTFQAYSSAELPAGSTLNMTITGKPRLTDAGVVTGGTSTGLIIGGGVLGLALAVAGVWVYSKRRSQMEVESPAEPDETSPEPDSDSLIDAIAALDDQFHSGRIPEPAYHQRRAELKEQLKRLLEQAK